MCESMNSQKSFVAVPCEIGAGVVHGHDSLVLHNQFFSQQSLAVKLFQKVTIVLGILGGFSMESLELDPNWHHLLTRHLLEINREMTPINLRWKDILDALKETMLEVVEKTCKTNQINRSKQKMPHTLGKKSYATLIDEIETMKDIRETYPELATSDVPIQEDIVSKVLGPKKSGYVRCFVIGPTPTDFATQRWGSVEIEREKKK
ncbi:hypothetical protein Cni_G16677 [Canna indica]|uniref:Uncharacterized protein n=1 Tax=Canna indica TaxID=4628 RepID=A0AAQ3KGW3_9LILI|nr:hypothetical protein Cni_G16677 [Canna indica]